MRNGRQARGRESWRAGHLAEAAAALFLRLKGYRIVARRLRTPSGEVDLVARRGGVLVIVEVKKRPDAESGLAAVHPRQAGRLLRAAEAIAAGPHGQDATSVRLDLVVIRPWKWPLHVLNAWQL